MKAEMQNTVFTHGKCGQCKYMALIDKFEQKKANYNKTEGEDGMTMELYQLILVCPICGYDFCEALFPNEVN